MDEVYLLEKVMQELQNTPGKHSSWFKDLGIQVDVSQE